MDGSQVPSGKALVFEEVVADHHQHHNHHQQQQQQPAGPGHLLRLLHAQHSNLSTPTRSQHVTAGTGQHGSRSVTPEMAHAMMCGELRYASSPAHAGLQWPCLLPSNPKLGSISAQSVKSGVHPLLHITRAATSSALLLQPSRNALRQLRKLNASAALASLDDFRSISQALATSLGLQPQGGIKGAPMDGQADDSSATVGAQHQPRAPVTVGVIPSSQASHLTHQAAMMLSMLAGPASAPSAAGAQQLAQGAGVMQLLHSRYQHILSELTGVGSGCKEADVLVRANGSGPSAGGAVGAVGVGASAAVRLLDSAAASTDLWAHEGSNGAAGPSPTTSQPVSELMGFSEDQLLKFIEEVEETCYGAATKVGNVAALCCTVLRCAVLCCLPVLGRLFSYHKVRGAI